MEATVAIDPAPSHDGEAEATRSTGELFQYSSMLHIGRGALDCEHAEDGACTLGGAEHFHAWVCLPNTFQIRDIADKARAARARKTRALRDPESDAHAVLEAELEELARDNWDLIVVTRAQQEVEKALPDIMRELGDDERFEHHAQDAEELRRLEALGEDERDPEEYTRLQADMLAYGEVFQKLIDARQDREEAALRGMPREQVIELERRSRIENIGNEMYLHTYYTWSMFICTRTAAFSSVRKFKRPEDLKDAPPEAVAALREKIKTLEERTTVRGDASGN